MKRFLALFLVLVMILAGSAATWADEETADVQNETESVIEMETATEAEETAEIEAVVETEETTELETVTEAEETTEPETGEETTEQETETESETTEQETETESETALEQETQVILEISAEGENDILEATSVKKPSEVAVKNCASYVKVTWSAASGADGYIVYRKAAGESKYTKVKVTSKRKYVDKKVKVGKKYYYRIKAYKKGKSKNYYSDYTKTVAKTYLRNGLTLNGSVSNTGITFDKNSSNTSMTTVSIDNTSGVYLASVKSSNKDVVTVSKVDTGDSAYNYALVIPQKKGKAIVTITGTNGKKSDVLVVVKDNYFEPALKKLSSASINRKGKVYIYSLSGATVKLKIGGKTYKYKVANTNATCVSADLNKTFAINTSYVVKVVKGGHSYTFKGKVISGASASFGQLWTCKRTIPMTARGIMSGDTVYVVCRGMTYYKYFSYSTDSASFTIYTNSNLGYVSSLRIYIKDSKGNIIYDRTSKVYWN